MSTLTAFAHARAYLTLSLLVILIVCFAVYRVFAGSRSEGKSASGAPAPVHLDAQRLADNPEPDSIIDRSRLDRHVVRALDALGDRFEIEAKARVLITASLTRNGGSPTQLTIVREPGDKLRVEEQAATRLRILGHDGSRSWGQGGPPNVDEIEFLDSLVRDSIEHFITGQAAGNATLQLGDMFRLDNGEDPGYVGPFYDILRVEDAYTTAGVRDSRPTLHYLNSQTGLPERIVYERGSKRVLVEFGNWAVFGGQKVPGRVVWQENGTIIRELTINQESFVASQQDGIFSDATAVSPGGEQ